MKKTGMKIGIVVLALLLIGGGVFLIHHHLSGGDWMNRYEWAKLIGEKYDINAPVESESSVEDVEKTNKYFKYIQAGIEQQIYNEIKFEGDKALTGDFMALTAVNVLGLQKFKVLLPANSDKFDSLSTEDCINMLVGKNCIREGELSQKITKQRAAEFIKSIEHLNEKIRESEGYQKSVYKDGVVQLPDGAVTQCNKEITEITVSEENMNGLTEGGTIVFAVGENKRMVAKRICKISGCRLTLTDIQDLSEVFEAAEGAGKLSYSPESIAEYYGKKWSNNPNAAMQVFDSREKPTLQRLGTDEVLNAGNITLNVTLTIQEKDGKKIVEPSVDVSYGRLNSSMTMNLDKNDLGTTQGKDNIEENKESDSAQKNVSSEKKATIYAQVNLKQIQVFTEYELFSKAAADIIVKPEVTVGAGGNRGIELEQTIFELPLGNGLVSGVIQFNLVADINGEIKITTDLSFGRRLGIDKSEGRLINEKIDVPRNSPTVEANITARAGVEPKIILNICGKQIADFKADILVQLTAIDRLKRREDGAFVHCQDLGIAAPIISVSICDDDASLFKKLKDYIVNKITKNGNEGTKEKEFSLSFDVVTADKAYFKKNYHFENSKRTLNDVCTCSDLELTEPIVEKKEVENSNQNLHYLRSTYNCVYYGIYWQDDTNEDGIIDKKDDKQPIKWRILSIKDNKILLISDKVLDYQYKSYDTPGFRQIQNGESGFEAIDWQWKNCSVNKWLNNEFGKNAFSTEQLDSIKEEAYNNDSTCKIALPSEDMIKNTKYGFNDRENTLEAAVGKFERCVGTRTATASPYAVQQYENKVDKQQRKYARKAGIIDDVIKNHGKYNFIGENDYLASYELSNTENFDYSEADVSCDGIVGWKGVGKEKIIAGIRPVITLDILEAKDLSFADKVVTEDDEDSNHRFNRVLAG